MKKPVIVEEEVDMWIPEALEHHKEGSLHRMLHVPKSQTLNPKLLERVMGKDIGDRLMNNGYDIPVTHLLKSRANLARTLKKFKHPKKE